jgi:hypothetical protein
MKDSVKDRRDVSDRISRVPGTLPVTEGTALEIQTHLDVDSNKVSRPYSIASKHERRRSS